MSDPVTNVDVEDVLSSIRRLVSDTNSDDRQEINVSEVAETKEEKTSKSEAKPADALLLTSALRVDTPDADSVPEFRHADLKNFRSTLSGEKPAEEEKPSAPQARWTPLANDEYYEDVEQQESAPVIDFIRHGGKVVKQQDAEPIAAEEDIWATGAEPQAESDEAELKAEAIFKTQNVEKTQSVEAKIIAETEPEMSAVTSVTAEEEPDFSTADENSEDSLVEEFVFASAAAASVMGANEENTPKAADVDLSDLDESVIEEEALRELVAEIVRQELTGDLGEKITRNVRKLVRREIHRAMLTREFE